jgi:hypothetical protein
MTQSMPPAKQSHTLRNIIIGVLVALFACVLCIGVVFAVTGGAILGVVNGLKDMSDTADVFVNDHAAGNYAAAYDMLDPTAQQSYGGSADALAAALDAQGIQRPSGWKSSNFDQKNEIGTVQGTATINGSAVPLTVQLKSANGKWKILSIAQGQ